VCAFTAAVGRPCDVGQTKKEAPQNKNLKMALRTKQKKGPQSKIKKMALRAKPPKRPPEQNTKMALRTKQKMTPRAKSKNGCVEWRDRNRRAISSHSMAPVTLFER
jgi:hypothetical protein